MKIIAILTLAGFIWLAHTALHYREHVYSQNDVNRLNSMVERLTAPTTQAQRNALVIADIWGIEVTK